MNVLTVHPGAYLQCHSYAIVGTSGVLLLDPGSGYEDAVVVESLRQHGISLAEIRAVLLTHYHFDHALGAGKWQDRGIPLYASRSAAEGLRTCSPHIWAEHPELIEPIEVDTLVDDTDVINLAGLRIECISTPGHTYGCVTYLVSDSNEAVAFTGDVLMPDSQPGFAGKEFSADALMGSLQRLRESRIDRAYPGHGDIGGDVAAWLSEGLAMGRAGQWRISSTLGSWDVPMSAVVTQSPGVSH